VAASEQEVGEELLAVAGAAAVTGERAARVLLKNCN
jgi:hypothetical protein